MYANCKLPNPAAGVWLVCLLLCSISPKLQRIHAETWVISITWLWLLCSFPVHLHTETERRTHLCYQSSSGITVTYTHDEQQSCTCLLRSKKHMLGVIWLFWVAWSSSTPLVINRIGGQLVMMICFFFFFNGLYCKFLDAPWNCPFCVGRNWIIYFVCGGTSVTETRRVWNVLVRHLLLLSARIITTSFVGQVWQLCTVNLYKSKAC